MKTHGAKRSALLAHASLLAKVDGFERRVRTERASDMECRSGCDACCHARLAVCDIEAAAMREALAALETEELADLLAMNDEASGRCVMLRRDGSCSVYQARPLVCRTQGLPLRYPEGSLAPDTVFARSERGPITWCPLNFRHEPPRPADVLDAERVDLMLAVSNRDYGGSPEHRAKLDELVRDEHSRRT